jgi:hypothetical protein
VSRECPPWCAGGHLCGVVGTGPVGQHRSSPRRVETAWGLLVYSRVANAGSPRSQLELRVVAVLDADEATARGQAEAIALEVDQAVAHGLLAGGWLDVDEQAWTAIEAAGRMRR